MTTAHTSVEEEIGHLIIGFLDASKHHFMTALADLGLTAPQGFALHHLKEPMAMSRLATEMGYDASHITGIVDKLEARGLVERRPDPHDRRVKLLVVTDAGVAVRRDVEKRAFARQPILERLTPAQRGQLRDLLQLAVGTEVEAPATVGLGSAAGAHA